MDILFLQGGGDDGYQADAALANSLQRELGREYNINYPEIQSNNDKADYGWPSAIGDLIKEFEDPLIIVAHSFGGSMLLKYLSENQHLENIKAIFLLSTPFWSGDEDWVQGLKLANDFAKKLPVDVPTFLYHCKDDDEVTIDHLKKYKDHIPWAKFVELESGGHQLTNDLSVVAEEIKNL